MAALLFRVRALFVPSVQRDAQHAGTMPSECDA